MMNYSPTILQRVLEGQWIQCAQPDASITHVCTDSRQTGPVAGAVFFALDGKRHKGAAFLLALYKAGIRHFVVADNVIPDAYPDANILKVAHTLRSIQALAAYHRSHFNYPVVGITGSNGKTIVKEWAAQLLHTRFNLIRSPKSYNSQIGVPISVLNMESSHDLAIFEAGISQAGEMDQLSTIIHADIGILTNIGQAHSEGFENDAVKLSEKMRLFEPAHTLIACIDQPLVANAVRQWAQQKPRRTLVSWAFSADAHAQFLVQKQDEGNRTTLILNQDAHQVFHIPFSDEASIQNALNAIILALTLGIEMETIRMRLPHLTPIEMRLGLKPGINRCTIVDDAYSNDLGSLRIALQFARQQSTEGPLTLILSDFLESGLARDDLFLEVTTLIRTFKVHRLIGIGTAIRALSQYLGPATTFHYYKDVDTFLRSFDHDDFKEEIVVVKGARAFAFERIVNRIEQKAHQAVLEVNLTAMVHNLHVYNRLLKQGTRMMAMVKAAGYGSGSAEVARLLAFHNVDYLGVAYTDEGIELRESGIHLPILVLNPEPLGFDAMYRYQLEPEVYSLDLLNALTDYTGTEKSMGIHLKLDTGMHRLGFESSDINTLIKRLKQYPNLVVRTIFSHLSASDSAVHDGFTHHQAAAFEAMTQALMEGLGYRPVLHLCNTGGIARFPQYHYDMVRLGIGLYGIDSSGLQSELKVVNTLKATISQIKQIPQGETIGYNRNGTTTRPSRIATINIGYADGFLRLAGGGRYQLWLHGKLVPTIGNICMDMTMIDITDVPEAVTGDEVIVFGENRPVEVLATVLHTIPYEIFTNIADRVKRVYWQE